MAAGVLAGTFWHVALSRVAYRAITLPLFATLGLALYVWRHRQVPGGGPMAAVLAVSGLWSLAYATQLLNSDLAAKILAFKVYFTMVPLVAVTWLLLGIELRQR